MAKRKNLLLTAALAIVCFTALLTASFVAWGGTPAQAAFDEEYENISTVNDGDSAPSINITRYEKFDITNTTDFPVNTTVKGLFVAEYSSNKYAMTMYSATSTSPNKARYVQLDGDIVTAINTNSDNSAAKRTMSSTMEDWMTWSVTRTASGLQLQTNSTYSSAQGKYLSLGNYGSFSLTTATTLTMTSVSGGGFTLKNSAGYGIKLDSMSSFGGNTTTYATCVTFNFYKETEVELTNPATISFDKGNDTATGTMDDVILSQDATETYVLPECGFVYNNYKFVGWKINDETTPLVAGTEITLGEKVQNGGITLTAAWEYDAWDLTFKMEGQEDKVIPVVKGTNYTFVESTDSKLWGSSSTPQGKLFGHWLNGETQYNKNDKLTPTENMIFTAVFVDACTVSFDFDGGAAPTSSYTTFKTTTVLPNSEFTLRTHEYTASYAPTKANYIFAGWENVKSGEKYQADLSNLYQQSVKVVIVEDTTFRAIWKFDGFTITFMVNDEVYATATYAKSTSTASQHFYFAREGIEIPVAPDGKEFAKWTTTSKYNSSYTYSISGSAGESNYAGQYLILPGEQTSETWKVTNYDVVLNATFQDKPISVVFKFKYEDGYKNGEIFKTENKTISATSSSQSVYLGNSYAGEAPEGYALLNWTDEDGKVYTSGQNVYIYRTDTVFEKTLTVHFAKSVHISFDGNGGTMSSTYANGENKPANSEYTLPRNTTSGTLTDYELVGFVCSADGEFYALGAKYQLGDEDVTFVAQWKYAGYILTFKVEGKDDEVVLVKKTENSSGYENTTYSITISNPSIANAEFLGWALNGDTSKLYKNRDVINLAVLQSLTDREGELVAQFRMKEMVTLTFHFGNDTVEKQVEKNSTYYVAHISSYFPDWTSYGYDWFSGWAANPELTGTLTSQVNKTHSADTHYYAVVEKTFKVTFVYGHGIDNAERTGRPSSAATVPYESTTTVNGVVVDIREGYTLLGWSTQDGGTVEYAAERTVTVDHECTLYAVWRYDYKKVTIQIVNGDFNETITSEVFMRNKTQYTLDDVLKKLSEEQKAMFAASEHRTVIWTNLDDGRTIGSNDKITYPTGKDQTTGEDKFAQLRVSVTDKLYTISFAQAGDTAIEPICMKFGADISELAPVPTRAGYEFVRWSNNGAEFAWTTMPGQNVTLTGVWTALQSTLKFDLNGGTTVDGKATMDDLTLLSATAFDKVADPIKEGYDFMGWTLNGADWRWTKHDTSNTYYGTMPGGTNTLVAKWELNSENRAALKAELKAKISAYAQEKGVEVPENLMDDKNTDTEAKIRKVYADVVEIIDYLADALSELNAYAQQFGVTLTLGDTLALRDADTKAEADSELILAKQVVDIIALANAKEAAKAEVAAKAEEDGVAVPDTDAIDAATTIEEVNSAKEEALAKIAEDKAANLALVAAKEAAAAELAEYAQSKGVEVPENAIDDAESLEAVALALSNAKSVVDSKAKVNAAKQAVAGLAGKTGEELFNQLKSVDAAVAALNAEEKAQVDLTAYNTAKESLDALVDGGEADLEVAVQAGAAIAVAKLGAAVTALALGAALAFILKRRMF